MTANGLSKALVPRNFRDFRVSRRPGNGCDGSGPIPRFLVLAIGLLLLVGCATGKPKVLPPSPAPAAAAQPTPAVIAQPSPPPPAGPSVVHFTDGREGFEIKEPTGLDSRSRADFDQATIMIREGKYEKAIELLEKLAAQSPELTAPHINLAIAYRHVNKPDQAEEHLKKALTSIPGHPVASNDYGLLLRKAGRFAESRQIYEKSLAAFPEYHPIHRNLAILCDLFLKDPACAVEHYEIYGKAVPRDEQVKLWLADMQTRSAGTVTAAAKH